MGKNKSSQTKTNLHIYKRVVKTLFGLRDENEKALTYTLGYVIANSPHFQKYFLKKAQISLKNGENIDSIDIENNENKGSRYDICVKINNTSRIIIEGKIYRNKPSPKQCKTYIKDFRANMNAHDKKSLILIYDWFDKCAIEEDIKKIISKVNESMRRKKGRLPWRGKAENYICSPLNWEDIGIECARILNLKSIDSKERQLLKQYADYIELERYTHRPINDLPLDDSNKGYLQTLTNKLIDVTKNYKKLYNDIEMIPAQNNNGKFLYAGIDRKEGYIGFKKENNHIFGLIFSWSKSVDIHLYICLPDGIPEKLLHYHDLLKKYWDGKLTEDLECWFNVNKGQDIDLLLGHLKQKGFFDEAIQQSAKNC